MPRIDGLDGLASKLRPYDPCDLVATAAALQLVPENAWHIIRFEVLAHVAGSLPYAPGKPLISPGNLKNLCNTGVLGTGVVAAAEDPIANPFTEAVTFHGGSFTVFPGLAEEVTFIVRHLAAAVFLYSKPFPDAIYWKRTEEVLLAVLALSDAVARKAGLGRSIMPPDQFSLRTVIPGRQRLADLKRAVAFTTVELQDLLARYRLPLSILDPLIRPLGTVSVEDYEIERGDLLKTPIVTSEHLYIIAIPSMLLSAVRDEIMRLAIECGVQGELAARYNLAAWETVRESFYYMDSRELPLLTPEPFPALLSSRFIDGFFNLDSDKLIYAMLVTDPFETTVLDERLGYWQGLTPHIMDRLEQIQEYVFTKMQGVNEVLFVSLIQGTERVYALTRGVPDAVIAPLLLLMSAADLYTLAQAEPGDRLALWKYTEAQYMTTQHTEILSAAGELDKFHFYRTHKGSFYHSDDTRPALLNLITGGTGSLRMEVAQERDAHAVLSYDLKHMIEVTSAYGTANIPIYLPAVDLKPVTPDRVTRLVEGLPLPVWIVGHEYSRDDEQSDEHIGLHMRYHQFAEAVAYWLWQLTSELEPVMEGLTSTLTQLQIKLHLIPDPVWLTPQDIPAELGEAIQALCDPERGQINVTVHPQMAMLIEGPSNSAELHMIRCILSALRDLLPNEFCSQLSDEALNRILTPHAQVPHKKIILAVRSGVVPQLDPRGLPPWRKVADADEGVLLDELGEYLVTVEGLRPGSIPDDQRVTLVRNVVTFFYKTLAHLVATLSPDMLLEHLVAQAEAVVYQTADHRLSLPTRQACFSEDTELLSKFGSEMQDLAQAAIASRFVIEYVAACPPHGIRPISLAVYDRLLALASHIVDYGYLCDLIHYKLADLKLSMLPSRRLGLDRAEAEKARKAYLPVFTAGEVARSTRHFKSHWMAKANELDGTSDATGSESPNAAPTSSNAPEQDFDRPMPGDLEELEQATRAEFGFSLGEIFELVAAAVEIGWDLKRTAACLPKDDLIERLHDDLGWTRERAADLIDQMSFGARPAFLKPPPPFKPADVYPWHYNRPLSYLRKPFLLREQSGVIEVVWGTRQVWMAWDYLFNLCTGGRLKATTQEMKHFLGKINEKQGQLFNDAVAELYSHTPKLKVRKQVEKIPGVAYPADLGDIDVLVADSAKRLIILIECKDLAVARTPYEMQYEYQRLFVGDDHQASIIEKQERRAAWFRAHLKEVLAWLGLKPQGRWRVEPLIVVDFELITPYMHQSPVPILSIEQIRRQLAR